MLKIIISICIFISFGWGDIISKLNEKRELQKCLDDYNCKILCEDKHHNKYIYYDTNKSFISCPSIIHYGCFDEKHMDRKELFCKKLIEN